MYRQCNGMGNANCQAREQLQTAMFILCCSVGIITTRHTSQPHLQLYNIYVAAQTEDHVGEGVPMIKKVPISQDGMTGCFWGCSSQSRVQEWLPCTCLTTDDLTSLTSGHG
jgi:hypothetical protein